MKAHTDFDQLGMSVITTMAWQIIYHYGVFSKVICVLQSFLTRNYSMKFIKSIEIFDRKVFNIIINYTFLTTKFSVNFEQRNSRF
jgi:hypothetical protein